MNNPTSPQHTALAGNILRTLIYGTWHPDVMEFAQEKLLYQVGARASLNETISLLERGLEDLTEQEHGDLKHLSPHAMHMAMYNLRIFLGFIPYHFNPRGMQEYLDNPQFANDNITVSILTHLAKCKKDPSYV